MDEAIVPGAMINTDDDVHYEIEEQMTYEPSKQSFNKTDADGDLHFMSRKFVN
jgi:hypothetical protein